MRYDDPWDDYPTRRKKRRGVPILLCIQSLLAFVLFAVVWVLGSSGTPLGEECGRFVHRTLTEKGDFSPVVQAGQDMWTRIAREPIFDSVKAVTARPADPMRYLSAPAEGEVLTPFTESAGGIEIGIPMNTPIKAAAGGKVVDIVRSDSGRQIIVQSGNLTIRYGCLSEVWTAVGDTVKRGQAIGCSGKKAGVELFTLAIQEDGKAIDPLSRIRKGLRQTE